jgi:hypothetical protein
MLSKIYDPSVAAIRRRRRHRRSDTQATWGRDCPVSVELEAFPFTRLGLAGWCTLVAYVCAKLCTRRDVVVLQIPATVWTTARDKALRKQVMLCGSCICPFIQTLQTTRWSAYRPIRESPVLCKATRRFTWGKIEIPRPRTNGHTLPTGVILQRATIPMRLVPSLRSSDFAGSYAGLYI